MKDLITLFRLTRAHGRVYGVAGLTVALGTLCYLLLPLQLGAFVDALRKIVAGHGDGSAARPILAIAGLLALSGFFGFIHSVVVSITSEKIVNELRAAFFANLVRRPLDRFKAKPLGEVASEFASDLALIQGGLSTNMVDFLRQGLFTFGALIALLLIDIRMTVFALIGIGIVVAIILWFFRASSKSLLAVQQYRSKLLGLLVESASNAYVIQAYDRVEFMNKRFTARLQETFARVRRHVILTASLSPVSLLVFSGIMAGVVFYGVSEVRGGHITVPHLVSYLVFVFMLVASVGQVSHLSGQLRQAGVMIAKHRDLLTPLSIPSGGSADEAVNPPKGRPETSSKPLGFIVRNLTFSYADTDTRALADVSFCIPQGEVTAITGESGAGKSTTAGILCGLLRPQAGFIEVLQDNAVVDATVARRSIAIVPQEPFLFAGTFFENITFGREWVTRNEVQRAATAARIHDHIMQHLDGYDGEVEERGQNLSRGQRQRLSIARALVGSPSVLVLDEATSSLDVVSERAIKCLLEELRGEVTIVIIAHQGELLANIDHLVILERARVSYEGRPECINAPGELARFMQVAINGSSK